MPFTYRRLQKCLLKFSIASNLTKGEYFNEASVTIEYIPIAIYLDFSSSFTFADSANQLDPVP